MGVPLRFKRSINSFYLGDFLLWGKTCSCNPTLSCCELLHRAGRKVGKGNSCIHSFSLQRTKVLKTMVFLRDLEKLKLQIINTF